MLAQFEPFHSIRGKKNTALKNLEIEVGKHIHGFAFFPSWENYALVLQTEIQQEEGSWKCIFVFDEFVQELK